MEQSAVIPLEKKVEEYIQETKLHIVKTGGTIDATNSAKKGKVAYSVEGGKRDRTAGPNDNLDSSKKGKAGGWE